MKKNTKELVKISILILFFILAVIGVFSNTEKENTESSAKFSYELSNIPEYKGEIYVEINNNIPKFTEEDKKIEEDYYSQLENKKVRNGNDKNKLEKSK